MIYSDGIEGIHGIGEADEPPLCPCGRGYVGHADHGSSEVEARIARGVRGRQLRRLIAVADRRTQRRFSRWIGSPSQDVALWSLYQEAEDLLERLRRLNIGGTL